MVSTAYLTYLKDSVSHLPGFQHASFFIVKDGVWINDKSGDPANEALKASLNSISGENRAKKIKDGAGGAVFLMQEGNVAVVANLPSKTRGITLHNRLKRLDEFHANATRAYRAHYDELTGVLNRHGIKDALERAHIVTSPRGTLSGAQQQVSNSSDIVLFAFDIDKFKSINDTYGHDVGDQVLAEFAYKLARTAEILSRSYAAKFVFGRPGGEEFELIAIGAFSKNDRADIGELLLAEIRKPAPNKSDNKTAPYPINVTASIGIARRRTPASLKELYDCHGVLRKEADAALYRAKNDGRNCLRAYEDILRKHGRVSEYFPDSNLVQIDIGLNVGTEVTQIYKIYMAPFLGTEIYQNGKYETLTAGDHPLIPTATIKVINVQAETSTAVIVERSASGDIPRGSLLRLVHTGSALTPEGRSASLMALVEPISLLYPEIEKARSINDLGIVAAIAGRTDEAEGRQITAIVNEFLSLTNMLLPTGSKVFSSLRGETYVLIPKIRAVSPSDAEMVFQNLQDSLTRASFKIYAGYCHVESLPDNFSRLPEALCFYAAAALNTTDDENRLEFFNRIPIQDFIYSWRQRGESEQALVDYQYFRRYGIESTDLDNQLGLAIMESEATEHYSLAEIALSRAANLDPQQQVYRANLALLKTHRQSYIEAVQEFQKIEEYVMREGSSYILAYAKSVLEAPPEAISISENDFADLLVQAANAYSESPVPPYDTWLLDIKRALKTGAFD